ncbi:hypothetical protein [Frigoriglobus tundricola]|uniref:hypothetical protein n=1 Tax=Frigoriglobus tundricola TaxID=2774151 RepID=UPI00148ECD84|nr:hypothetical protein [Frigoriglobus tundricola]
MPGEEGVWLDTAPGPRVEAAVLDRLPVRPGDWVPLAAGVLVDALPTDIAALSAGLRGFFDRAVTVATGPGDVPDGPDPSTYLLHATLAAGLVVGGALVLWPRSAPPPALDPCEAAGPPTPWSRR